MSKVIELPSLAVGLAGSIEPGSETIEAIHGAGNMRLVTENQIARAIKYCYETHGQLIEGSGAVGIALAMNDQLSGDGNSVILVTGGILMRRSLKRQ